VGGHCEASSLCLRSMLTASQGGEPALQQDALRHGVFTCYLLEALKEAATATCRAPMNVPEEVRYPRPGDPQSASRRSGPRPVGFGRHDLQDLSLPMPRLAIQFPQTPFGPCSGPPPRPAPLGGRIFFSAPGRPSSPDDPGHGPAAFRGRKSKILKLAETLLPYLLTESPVPCSVQLMQRRESQPASACLQWALGAL
jgi:hypothetical protein